MLMTLTEQQAERGCLDRPVLFGSVGQESRPEVGKRAISPLNGVSQKQARGLYRVVQIALSRRVGFGTLREAVERCERCGAGCRCRADGLASLRLRQDEHRPERGMIEIPSCPRPPG